MKTRRCKAGFTLAELVISSTLLVMVCTGILSFYILLQNVWHRGTMAMTTSLKACTALNRMVYGASISNAGLRSASETSVGQSWSSGSQYITYNTNKWFRYEPTAGRISDQDGNVLVTGVQTFTGMISGGGITLSISLCQTTGQHSVTSSMSTFVMFRN